MKLGFDIGGTAIKYGVVRKNGEILYSDKVPTPQKNCGREIPALLMSLYEKLSKEYPVSGIGIGTLGTVDAERGIVLYAANLHGFSGTNLKSALHDTGLSVAIDNDVNVQALGEYYFGAAKKCDYFLMVSLGTGLGGAVFLNGHPVKGRTHGVGEFGHMVIERGGRVCECGKKGCFQTYCSARAVVKSYFEKTGDERSLKELFHQIDKGESSAMEVYTEFLEYMGIGLSNLIHAFDPKRILIGGGISEVPRLLKNLRERTPKFLFPSYAEGLDLVAAELGNRAGIVGAAAMTMRADE